MIAFSSGTNFSSSSSVIAIRASLAMWRTCSGFTDMDFLVGRIARRCLGADSGGVSERQASAPRGERSQREARDPGPEVALERLFPLAVVDGAPDDDLVG